MIMSMKKNQEQTNKSIALIAAKMDKVLFKAVSNSKSPDSKLQPILLYDDDETLLSDSENSQSRLSDIHSRRLLPSSPGPFDLNDFVENL